MPAAVYRDRHGAFEQPEGKLPPAELRLADTRRATQVGRALAELGIRSIAARSPQAKGRVERLFGTLQDRLVTELRLAGVSDRAGAEQLLRRYLARHNARFGVAAADPTPAWRVVPPRIDLDAVLAFRYRRVAANDHTVRIGGLVLDVPRQGGDPSLAGRRVELSLRLDGRIMALLGERWVTIARITLDPARLRSLESARPVLRAAGPSLRTPDRPDAPGPDHPWRRATPGSRLEAIRREEARLTDSQIS